MFGEAYKTFITSSAAAETIVRLSREKAAFHTSGTTYWRERQKRALAQEEIEKLWKHIQGVFCFQQ